MDRAFTSVLIFPIYTPFPSKIRKEIKSSKATVFEFFSPFSALHLLLMSIARPGVFGQLPFAGVYVRCPSHLGRQDPTRFRHARKLRAGEEKGLYDYQDEPPPKKQYVGEALLEDPDRPTSVNTEEWARFKIPHRFQGVNTKRLDIQRFPRFKTNFDGQKGKLAWMGTECQKCGLQIRRERRTNRETSLNVYAHASIPIDMLRSCTEKKMYPLLWRTRDPFVALDILGVDD
ncbi:hypothetical protein BSKO_00249 [Bryopsis sp. KO-2023]|nr:hypothetical protein BSKO_00249 [Bryopsis sp. KO-2023]